MFCKQCGKNMSEDARFCPSCGTNKSEVVIKQAAPVAQEPDYEFRTEKCYPTTYSENEAKNFYQDLGWAILDMDRKQFRNADGYTTSTFIKMRRNKNIPNYEQINELSKTAELYFDTYAKAKVYPIALYIVLGIFACSLIIVFMHIALKNLLQINNIFICIVVGLAYGGLYSSTSVRRYKKIKPLSKDTRRTLIFQK